MSEQKATIYEKLMHIQNELNAPKNLYNSFGKYSYRSCESILESAKPIAMKHGCVITLTDDIFREGDRYYIQAIAMITDVATGDSYSTTAFAREPESKKGMDESQITGSCSSYARKYALGGLLDIDDNKDADTNEQHNEAEARSKNNDPKVGVKQVEQLSELAGEAGVSFDAICERFGVATVQDLTMPQFVKVVKMLEATRKKNAEVA